MIRFQPTAIESDEIHLWLVSLAMGPEDLAALQATLSADELRRAERLRRRTDRRRFVAGRGLARCVLSAYLGRPAARIGFSYGDMGQPRISDAADTLLRFNLSHCDDLLLLGVACGRPVGVDLERIRPLPHREAIERRIFSPREREVLCDLAADGRLRGFFSGWTRKEAVAKALGDGMWSTVGRVQVSLDPESAAEVLALDGSRKEAKRWSLFHLEPATGFVGSAAVRGRDLQLSVRDVRAEAAGEDRK